MPILVTFEEVPINIRSSEMGKNLYISWIGGLNSKGNWRTLGVFLLFQTQSMHLGMNT